MRPTRKYLLCSLNPPVSHHRIERVLNSLYCIYISSQIGILQCKVTKYSYLSHEGLRSFHRNTERVTKVLAAADEQPKHHE